MFPLATLATDRIEDAMADATSSLAPALDREKIAPWWHTIVFIVFLLAIAAADVVRIDRGSLDHPHRLRIYLSSIVFEFGMLAYVWLLGLRPYGKRLSDLIGGKWTRVSDFFRDVGVAFLFWLIVATFLIAIRFSLGDNLTATKAMKVLLPQTGIEMAVWVCVSVSAGFVEECLFRGYLQRQFLALTGNKEIAVVLQAIVFGLAHSYQGRKGVVTITVYGALFGVLAVTRNSLRPGMMQHMAQDTFTGIVGSLLAKRGYM
jgi:membrane protease YdiL (CAAX protease family)